MRVSRSPAPQSRNRSANLFRPRIPLTALEDSITSVVDAVSPSVVTISTVEVVRDFHLRPFPREGTGSGFVVREDGWVATNHHVIQGARSAQVTLPSGQRLSAELVTDDPDSDLALLRIPTTGLTPARLGDSDAVRVGQLAIAIGSPFGLMLKGPTVTVGVVSARERTLQTRGGVIGGLLQTDAPINPGNSGGPLLNTAGEVIGINTAIIPDAQGIGFAVPANELRRVVEQAVTYGRVLHPWIGVQGATLTPALAQELGLHRPRGVVIVQVEPGSPASVSGLGEADVLLRAEGADLASVEALRQLIARRGSGTSLRLEVARNGSVRTVRVPIVERPA